MNVYKLKNIMGHFLPMINIIIFQDSHQTRTESTKTNSSNPRPTRVITDNFTNQLMFRSVHASCFYPQNKETPTVSLPWGPPLEKRAATITGSI